MDTNPLNVEDNLNRKIALFQEIKVDIRSLPFRKYIFKRHRTNNNLSSTFNYLIRWISEIRLTKTEITPGNGISLVDFRSNSSVSAIMSELTWRYPLNSCTFLTVGYAIARQKHRFFEPEKHIFNLYT